MMPAPGSPEAIEAGCTCDPEVNHNGLGLQASGQIVCRFIGNVLHLVDEPVWEADVNCPLHEI